MLECQSSRWTVRPSRSDDAAAMVALFNERREAAGEKPTHTIEGLQRWFEQPTHPTLKTDCVIHDESGALIGWAGLTEAPPPYKKLLFSIAPRVALAGCDELWDVLSDQLDRFARDVVQDLPSTERPVLRTFCLLRDEARQKALVRNGYELARVQNKMKIDLSTAPPEPQWLEGIELSPFEYERDIDDVVAAYQEAFETIGAMWSFPMAMRSPSGARNTCGKARSTMRRSGTPRWTGTRSQGLLGGGRRLITTSRGGISTTSLCVGRGATED